MNMNKNRWIKFGGFWVITLLLLFRSGGTASTARAATVKVSISGTLDYNAAEQILSMVNAQRAANGVSPVVTNTALQEYAMLRAQELAISYSHTRPNGTRGLDGIPDRHSKWGENIACGNTSAAAVMNAWMNSTDHRANILDPKFAQIGIGCYYTNRTWYWAQCFNARAASSPVPSGAVSRTTAIETDPALLDLSMAGPAPEVREGGELSLHIMHQNPYSSTNKVELLPSGFSWSSADPSTATVSDAGILTGISVGQAKVRASLSGCGTITGVIPVVHDPGDPATCTSAQICKACGAELSPALGHQPGSEPTCTAAQKCTRCGAVLKEKLGHLPGPEPTCTTAQKCTRCGTVLKEKLAHLPGPEPTCTANQTCTRCGATLAWALGHQFAETVVKPTETNYGYTLHKCQRCGYSYQTDYVPATGPSSGSSSSGGSSLGGSSSGGSSSGGSASDGSSSGSSSTPSSTTGSSAAKGGTKKSTTSSITLRWNSDARATAGYAVAINSGSQYVLVDFVGKEKKTYTLKRIGAQKLKAGTSYTVWIVPVQKIDGRTVLITSNGNIFKTSTAPKAASLTSAVRKTGTTAVLKWKKVSGADGYQIQMSTKSSSGFKKIKTLSSGKKSYTKTNLSKNKTYYFRIRAYKEVTGGRIYGAWSKVKKVKK